MPPNRASGKGSSENRGFVLLPAAGVAPGRAAGSAAVRGWTVNLGMGPV
jgi:hypothetical protein